MNQVNTTLMSHPESRSEVSVIPADEKRIIAKRILSLLDESLQQLLNCDS